MKRLARLMMLAPIALFAAQNDSQTVNISVSAINELKVTGAVTLSTVAATPGQEITSVSDSSSTLSLTTNAASKKVTVSAVGIPAGVQLKLGVNLDAPGVRVNTGAATAVGATNVTLSTGASDLITAISKAILLNAPLTYTLTTSTSAGSSITAAVSVTYTLTS